MQYNIDYSCGHTGTVNLFGPGKERERKISYLKECVCPACEAEERKNQAEAAADSAQEMGLPKLRGTEKQIAWAERLRELFMAGVVNLTASIDAEARFQMKQNPEKVESLQAQLDEDLENVAKAADLVLGERTTASWWIDERYTNCKLILRRVIKQMGNTPENIDTSRRAEDAASANADATVFPDQRTHDGAVEIAVCEDSVTAQYPKDDSFRGLVRNMGYTWDGDLRAWEKKINFQTGSATDRAAELGNALLRAGFAVTVHDEDIRRRAENAEFEPECKRWVAVRTSGKYSGYLSIIWPKGEQEIYDAARRIHGSKWDNPNMVVPISFHAEVEDFAEHLGFRFSPGAIRAINAYEASKRPTVSPAKPPVLPDPENKLRQVLESAADVLPDLEDN